ncbi:MAG: alkaline phosphatase family protein [Limisphaerales bacterium]
MKFSKIVGCCVLFIFAVLLNSRAAFDTNRIVVLVSLDGLAAFYFDDPKAQMPNLHALAEQGAKASSMMAVIPTVTWPNHTTLVTGVTPEFHGVVGNNYFDRHKNVVVTLIQDPVFDKEEIVKAPTIYDAAKAAGLKTAGIHWPATRNAKSLDWQVPATRSIAMQRRFTTPSLIKECAEHGIVIVDPAVTERKPDEFSDALSTDIFDLVLTKHRPQFAMLHIGNSDHAQHEHGPRSDEAYAAIKEVDVQLGKVWKELQADYPERATLFVVSDHGFSSNDHFIPIHSKLHQLGFEAAGKTHTNRVECVIQGGSVMLYIMDRAHRRDIEKKIVKAFGKEKGVTRVLTAVQFRANGLATPEEDPHAPDIFVLSGSGYAFGDTSSGKIPASEKPERHGSHGHDPLEPDLHATFVAWGVGIKPGARLGEIRNIDVAPTIAKVLEVELPSAQGKPLNKILTP